MRNSFGQAVTVTLFGESHGAAVGAVLDGMAPGLAVDETFLAGRMALRRAAGQISTARQEEDRVRLLSGVYRGHTTGTPITFLIENQNTRSSDYEATAALARPGHADFTAREKYHGYADPRGGGHFSGRLTAGLVAAGALCLSALSGRGIAVGTHVARCAGIDDRPFAEDPRDEIAALSDRAFAVLDRAAGERMQQAILAAKAEGDSVGGILETAVTGLPAGVGEPWFDTLEGVLAHALFSVPAVKGVEFGDGFALADLRGSVANDPFRMRAGQVVCESNRAGGILGGISTGMPLRIRTAVKPTPSIYKEQRTVDLDRRSDATLTVKGRHDPAVVHRARAVVDAVTALCLCDLLAQRFGTDWLAGKEAVCSTD